MKDTGLSSKLLLGCFYKFFYIFNLAVSIIVTYNLNQYGNTLSVRNIFSSTLSKYSFKCIKVIQHNHSKNKLLMIYYEITLFFL